MSGFLSWTFHNSPIVRKLKVPCPTFLWRSYGRGIHCLTFHNEKRVCARWILQGRLGVLMGLRIRYRVCGYFHWWRTSISVPFTEYSKLQPPPPPRDQIIFISKKGNELFVTIWTLYFLSEGGRFVSFVHIFEVNGSCWLPASLFNVCWNYSNQSLIYCTLFFPLNTTRSSSWYMLW